MNKTKSTFPLNVLGAFAPSGFFKKTTGGVSKPAPVVTRRHYEAATAAQTARLCEVLGRGMASHLRY